MTQFLLNKNKKDLAETSAKTDENESRDPSLMVNIKDLNINAKNIKFIFTYVEY
jgi:hypothetical protein